MGAGGCFSAIDSVWVEIDTNQIVVSPSGVNCLGDDFTFSVEGGGDYSWTGPNGFNSTSAVNTIYNTTLSDYGTYTVVVTYQNGCDLSGQVDLTMDEARNCFLIPEIITPNGDGQNDYFVIDWLHLYPNNSLVVFNRWGATVYYMEAYNNDFKGVANQGIDLDDKSLPNGSYFYVLNLNDGLEVYKGVLEIQK